MREPAAGPSQTTRVDSGGSSNIKAFDVHGFSLHSDSIRKETGRKRVLRSLVNRDTRFSVSYDVVKVPWKCRMMANLTFIVFFFCS